MVLRNKYRNKRYSKTTNLFRLGLKNAQMMRLTRVSHCLFGSTDEKAEICWYVKQFNSFHWALVKSSVCWPIHLVSGN